MSRIKILGLALMAVFALSAVVASSAMAELPEFKSGSGFPVKFTGTSGPGTLGTVATGGKKHEVSCTSDESTGQIVSARLVHLTIVFKGCKNVQTGVACNSGSTSGVIQTQPLTAIPLYESRSNKTVGLQAKPESGEFDAEFECKTFGIGDVIKVKGTQNSSITPVNTTKKTFLISTALSGGKQIPAALENAAGTKFTALQETKGEGVENFGFEESASEGKGSILTASEVLLEA